MTTIKIKEEEGAIVVGADGSLQVFMPKSPNNARATLPQKAITMMAWAVMQKDLKERFSKELESENKR